MNRPRRNNHRDQIEIENSADSALPENRNESSLFTQCIQK
jgi:hypothetical protein